MATCVQDIRYALRLLIRKPAFSIVAILTLALGIGATTAIFTVVNAVLLNPLPFRDAERLVEVRIVGRTGDIFPLPDADFLAWRAQNETSDAIAVYDGSPVTVLGDGAPERVGASGVTDRFFDVLGARPLLGRVFHEGDDKPDAPKIAVLSHTFWTRRFRSDPSVVGRPISFGGTAHTIVGVMPPDFHFPKKDVEVWRILTMKTPERRGPFYTSGIARLKPGVSIAEMRANLAMVTAALKRAHPGPEDWTLDALPLQDSIVGNVRRMLYVLLGAVGFLLLIATANVANLGPDLTDIGVRSSPGYLRRAIVDPQADRPGGFKQVHAVTRDGRRTTGVVVNEDTFSIQFRDAGGTLYSFFKDELAELAADRRTTMPSFRERLEPNALDDLVAYLVSLEGTR